MASRAAPRISIMIVWRVVPFAVGISWKPLYDFRCVYCYINSDLRTLRNSRLTFRNASFFSIKKRFMRVLTRRQWNASYIYVYLQFILRYIRSTFRDDVVYIAFPAWKVMEAKKCARLRTLFIQLVAWHIFDLQKWHEREAHAHPFTLTKFYTFFFTRFVVSACQLVVINNTYCFEYESTRDVAKIPNQKKKYNLFLCQYEHISFIVYYELKKHSEIANETCTSR